MSNKLPIKKMSVVIPVYNEAEGIGSFFDILISELHKLQLKSFEIIFVNDGSTDGTAQKLRKIFENHKQTVKIINLTRNFGKEAALSAGMHSAKGDCVVTLDADGQHPPARIKDFLKVYNEDYDMVVGMRSQNLGEKRLKKLGNTAYYKMLKIIGITNLQPRATDFRIMSREVVDAFCLLTERRRIARGLLDWMGFRTAFVEFEAPQRIAGNATYSMKKLLYLGIDSILSNSRKPLAVSIILGAFMAVLGLLGAVFVLLESYLLNDPLGLNFTGTALLLLVALFMIGVILISQGIASLYLARIYEESQKRPLYIISQSSSSLSSGDDEN